MRTRSLSILATTATLAALLGCPIEGLKTPDAASLGAESDSVGGVANSPSHDDAVDAAEDVSWADGQMPAGKSALRVLMTDAPVEADSVFVTFCGVFVEPATGDVAGSDPGVSRDPREPGAGGYGGSGTGAAGAPSAAPSAGAGGSGSGGAAGAPSPEYDAEKAEAERQAEAERAEAERAEGTDPAAPIDPEREAAEREAAEREAAEREAAEREAAEGVPTDDRGGVDAVAPGTDGAPREAWRPLNQECQTVDLLTLRNGVTEAVGVATLPPGRYGQIRLMLMDASIVVDGVEHELAVPSGMESGLKIQGGFELLDGAATTITLDFDAGASVHYIEGSGYLLRPVINVIDVISHADEPGAEPREPAWPGTDPSAEPSRGGSGGSAGAGGAGGDGAGGRASVPPPPPGEEPPPPPPPGEEPPKAGDEPHAEPPPPPPPGEEPPPPAEEPEEP